MEKTVIQTDSVPKAIGPYSQGIRMGNMLFCSGQISIDPKSNEVKLGSIEEQAHQVLKNVGQLLEAGGCQYSDVVKTTIFLVSMSDFAKVNEIYGQYFKAPYPARSTVAVKELPKGVQVEIEVLAVKS